MTDPPRGLCRGFAGFAVVVASFVVFTYLEGHGSTLHTRAGSTACKSRHHRRDRPRAISEGCCFACVEDVQFRAAVREGIAQADRGEFIEEEEMDARFEEMLRS